MGNAKYQPMIKYTLILICFLNSPHLFGINSDSTKQKATTNLIVDDGKSSPLEIQLKLPDTLQVENLKGNVSWFEKYFPAIVVLFVGLVSAIINLLIGRNIQRSNEKTRISNENNLRRQIESSEKLTKSNYKATLAIQNKQEWINNVRHELSAVISRSVKIAFKKQFPKNDASDMDEDFEKLKYHISKVELLLSSDNPQQKNVTKSVKMVYKSHVYAQTFNSSIAETDRNNAIDAGRNLIKSEWNKIQQELE